MPTMELALAIAGIVASLGISIWVAVLALECLLALTWRPVPPESGADHPSVAVLIPAHNEESGIANTLRTIVSEMRPGDRVLVVADNCTDHTVELAQAAGAQVVERHDTQRRGKGYALDFGVRFMETNPPAVVVIVDADCQVHPGSIAALANQAAQTGRPAQAVNLLDPPATPLEPSRRDQVSAFAFRVKNLVRPLGLRQLGLPCMLSMGNAFSWNLIRTAPLASGNIVEDMQLGLDLARAGSAPLLCPAATVTGRLPAQDAAARTQRTRWEHGHLQTIAHNVPKLFAQGVLSRRMDLLALALDLCVPPLSILVLGWAAALALTLAGWWWVGGGTLPWPAIVTAASGVVLLLTILAAWSRFAREVLPLATLLTVPFYILWKIPLYLGFLRHRQKTWVRTAR